MNITKSDFFLLLSQLWLMLCFIQEDESKSFLMLLLGCLWLGVHFLFKSKESKEPRR